MLFNRELSPRRQVLLGRAGVLVVAAFAMSLAWTQNDTILALVAFAWAGFGASFGPVVILSLFWRKLTAWGALASMVSGAVIVGWFGNASGGPGHLFDYYELLPGFVVAMLVGVVVSLATHHRDEAIEDEFDQTVFAVKHAHD